MTFDYTLCTERDGYSIEEHKTGGTRWIHEEVRKSVYISVCATFGIYFCKQIILNSSTLVSTLKQEQIS